MHQLKTCSADPRLPTGVAGVPSFGGTCLAVLTLLTATWLCGCTPTLEYFRNGFKVGPNYGRPPAPVARDWIDGDDVRVRKSSDDLSRWWAVFNDPALDALV